MIISMLPGRRRIDLIVQRVSDETLLYDERNDRAHCLNRAATLVWEHCDELTTDEEIAVVLNQELGIPQDVEVVRQALRTLEKANLLEPVSEPRAKARNISRRELARRLGLAAGMAIALPLVSSIVAPTPLMAASCSPRGGICGEGQGQGTPCCAGSRCSNNRCV
jgi:hypothetical protein